MEQFFYRFSVNLMGMVVTALMLVINLAPLALAYTTGNAWFCLLMFLTLPMCLAAVESLI